MSAIRMQEKAEQMEITPGFWWARYPDGGTTTIIKVFAFDETLTPGDRGYGELRGIVMGSSDDEETSGNPGSLAAYFEFIARIPEPA